jgi:hypothetical protein
MARNAPLPRRFSAWTKRRRTILLAVLGLIVFLGLGFVIQLFGDLDGDTYVVEVRNDTARSLWFTYCVETDCSRLGGVRLIEPGKSFKVNSVAADHSLDNFVVHDGAGNVRGCLYLGYPKAMPGLVLHASATQSCPLGHAPPPTAFE